MSYVSHRRPTPVPTDSILVFGKEISQLPAISESPPEKPERSFVHHMESPATGEKPAVAGMIGTSKPWIPETITPGSDTESKKETTPVGTADNGEGILLTKEVEREVQSVKLSVHDLHENHGVNGHPSPPKDAYVLRGAEEDVQEALLTLFLVIFHLGWSIGVGFWHLGDGKMDAARLTFSVILISGILTQLSYFCNGNIHKAKIWSTSKLLWLLFLIPCTLPIFMALSNLVFAAKEAKDPRHSRPWTNTRSLFLVESLALGFPQSVLQITLLMEDVENFPSIKGAVVAGGLLILSGGITYARIRFDSADRWDRFGVGTEKYIRYTVIWAAKVLWLLTYCCLIVSIRIQCGKENVTALIMSIIILQIFFEIPILASTINACRRLSGFLLSLFFLIPQFAALTTLIFWVNVDLTVYEFNIGGCILGMFFGTESLAIMGWLLDRCMGRDIDFFPLYPHFFGNLYLRCCK